MAIPIITTSFLGTWVSGERTNLYFIKNFTKAMLISTERISFQCRTLGLNRMAKTDMGDECPALAGLWNLSGSSWSGQTSGSRCRKYTGMMTCGPAVLHNNSSCFEGSGQRFY